MMFGRKIRLPVDVATGRTPDEELPAVNMEYAVVLQKRMEAVHHHTQEAGRGSNAVTFEAGDKVWLYNPQRR